VNCGQNDSFGGLELKAHNPPQFVQRWQYFQDARRACRPSTCIWEAFRSTLMVRPVVAPSAWSDCAKSVMRAPAMPTFGRTEPMPEHLRKEIRRRSATSPKPGDRNDVRRVIHRQRERCCVQRLVLEQAGGASLGAIGECLCGSSPAVLGAVSSWCQGICPWLRCSQAQRRPSAKRHPRSLGECRSRSNSSSSEMTSLKSGINR
jgi:hypothetical protein